MKACGDCRLCCLVLHVETLAKPPGVLCPHAGPAGGCGIHGRHPEDCLAFACGWLQWEELGEAWRPDRCGFLIRNEPSQGRLNIDVDPARPDAWRDPACYPTLKGWSHMIRRREGCVLVLVGDRATVIFPEEDIAIGVLRPEEELAVGYLKGPGWTAPLVRLLRDGEIVQEWRGQKRAA